jgi:gamma-glutamyltranspeptidase/glutathione hydrolase
LRTTSRKTNFSGTKNRKTGAIAIKVQLFLVPFFALTACSSQPSARDGTGAAKSGAEVAGAGTDTTILAANTRSRDTGVEAHGPHYAVATQGRAATQAAHEILAAGGNLIDATIAASFTISV